MKMRCLRRPCGNIVNGLALEIVLWGNIAASSVEIDHPNVFNLELVDLESVIYTNTPTQRSAKLYVII